MRKKHSLLFPTSAKAGIFCPQDFLITANQSSRLSKLCALVISYTSSTAWDERCNKTYALYSRRDRYRTLGQEQPLPPIIFQHHQNSSIPNNLYALLLVSSLTAGWVKNKKWKNNDVTTESKQSTFTKYESSYMCSIDVVVEHSSPKCLSPDIPYL